MTNKKLPEIGRRYKLSEGTEDYIVTIIKFNDDVVTYADEDLTQEYSKDVFNRFFEEIPNQEPTKNHCYICKRSVVDKVKTGCEEIDGNKYCRHCNPKQEPTTKPDSANNAPTEGVGEALEEMQDFIRAEVQTFRMPYATHNYVELFQLAQNLVNALDKSLAHPNTQETPVSSIVEPARESNWQPIETAPGLTDADNSILLLTSRGQVVEGYYTEGGQEWIAMLYHEEHKTIQETPVSSIVEQAREEDHKKGKPCRVSYFIAQNESLERRIERLEQLTKESDAQ